MFAKTLGVVLLGALAGTSWAAAPGQSALSDTGGACSETQKAMRGGTDYCDARMQWMRGDVGAAERKMRRAATLNNVSAQYVLGVAYFNGDGVKKDRAYGLAWLALAAQSGTDHHLGTFKSAYGKTSAEERSESEQILARLTAQVASRTAINDNPCIPGDSVRSRLEPTGCKDAVRVSEHVYERMAPAASNVASVGSSR